MKTLVAFVKGAISKEETFFGTKLEFVIVIRVEMRPTRATKHLKKV
jgi:hypothetical protein